MRKKIFKNAFVKIVFQIVSLIIFLFIASFIINFVMSAIAASTPVPHSQKQYDSPKDKVTFTVEKEEREEKKVDLNQKLPKPETNEQTSVELPKKVDDKDVSDEKHFNLIGVFTVLGIVSLLIIGGMYWQLAGKKISKRKTKMRKE